jgi:bifunctional ADP-heptose synthase (sugar kinase/adenylyltransferase)
VDVDQIVAELYGLPPKEFVAARDVRVAEARQAKDPAAARTLAVLLDGPLVLVTEGAAGMTLFDAGSCCHLPARVEPAIDTLGAGDAVVAAFALGLAAGRAPVAAAALASAAAGVVVQRRGTHAVSTDALRRMLFDESALVTDDGAR